MDRRKYLKTLAAGTVTSGILLNACAPEKAKTGELSTQTNTGEPSRQPGEIERFKKLSSEVFFTPHEMAAIAILSEMIIPKDAVSGGAADARVPDFIEFIAKDMPQYQVPLRGGLKWLDLHCFKLFGRGFSDCDSKQQIEMADLIAFPEQAKVGMEQGVAFFNLMRDLTVTGFYTTEIGIKDLGYVGNQPNQWDGVPQAVLDQYGLKYDERTIAESIKFEN
jgi:gluconate 2-dehydrogenase gamma chain